jgi:hypothetical protein
MSKIDSGFEAAVDESLKLSKAKGYVLPSDFMVMRAKEGGNSIPVVSRLVRSGEMQSGFKRLKALNLLDWSLEALVPNSPNLFQQADIDCAKFRLDVLKKNVVL